MKNFKTEEKMKNEKNEQEKLEQLKYFLEHGEAYSIDDFDRFLTLDLGVARTVVDELFSQYSSVWDNPRNSVVYEIILHLVDRGYLDANIAVKQVQKMRDEDERSLIKDFK
jgi:hypothetical protein